ncbi:regulatory protein, tetR family [Saccharopolyspora antimicrobica]|uniref:Regulatory protein, tetR family n=1 Tax=Saccharopolyspora antimicrobica TaxID=455193 RepID=A0A1I4YH42_9PSEU|nr:TetR/AcrR family transcriptional regulator [Saccharopolyspora antimicrobica]RKT82674.1 TetR family transcriptional regulator [Saccharopolyspora antimicrobica]SFN37348.1 regulatory protein, tetR family [Saccharopolyspora antimicrobica]
MRCAQCGAELPVASRGRPRRYCGRACQARAYRARKDGVAINRRSAARTRAAEINRAGVLRAAIRLADAEGMPAVSMQRVAALLGIAAMTLYRHVRSKDELVTAMVDAVLAEQSPPERSGGWRAQLEHEARQEWQLYQRHPWVLPVLASTRPPLGGAVLAAVDRSLAALSGRGLDHRAALSTYLLVSGYVQGMALLVAAESQAVRDTGVRSETWWSKARSGRFAGLVDSGWYPWLTELAVDDFPGPDPVEGWFDFGLQRVLDGIAVFLGELSTSD